MVTVCCALHATCGRGEHEFYALFAVILTGEGPNLHSTADSEVALKAVGAAIVILVALYFADQVFAQGKYTDAAQRMAMQIRHSTGI